MKTIWALLILVCYGKTAGKAEAYLLPETVNDQKVFIITLDGFRWQELFAGADRALLQHADAKGGTKELWTQFYHPNPKRRRQLLMPFMWTVVSRQGQLLGNRRWGSRVNCVNPYALSYAGYNELFTGRPDYFIWNNAKQTNVNRTVLEYLNRVPALKGKIASIASWELFPYIFNQKRSKIFLNSGKRAGGQSEKGVRSDSSTYAVAQAYILRHQPRVLHLGLSGTDEAGHQKDYGQYLREAHLADQIIARLWELVQSLGFYKNKTTFIITTDHGRGNESSNWFKHGFFIPGSSQTWIALLGNNIAPLGESNRSEQLYSRQIAGTISYLLRVSRFGRPTLPLTFCSGVRQAEKIFPVSLK